uniref:Uncharacterized protein n=1 Tax=Vespula pensylvanica TaxID=30213 RepID=A0A834UHI8_VESPE|nr:hypothetical protein H0235_001503 [Vespula pensylvanica]
MLGRANAAASLPPPLVPPPMPLSHARDETATTLCDDTIATLQRPSENSLRKDARKRRKAYRHAFAAALKRNNDGLVSLRLEEEEQEEEEEIEEQEQEEERKREKERERKTETS